MVSTVPENLVSGARMSSVVPAEVTSHKDHRVTNVDLALKLHYIRGVYIFKSEAVQGLTAHDLKKAMFPLLALYYTASGRIRKSGSSDDRPFVKCNDGGVRVVEARCENTTVEEWLAMKNDHRLHLHSVENSLSYDLVLGPDLGFSPLVFVQLTWFKCGGLAVGLSWAHILGDILSASNFINMWARIVQGHVTSKLLHVPKPVEPEHPPSNPKVPLSLKRVDPVEDCWLPANNCNLETHSFHFTAKHLDNISSKIHHNKKSYFAVLSAIIWKSLSKSKDDSKSRTVTICERNNPCVDEEFPSNNNMMISILQADFPVVKADVIELMQLIGKNQKEENGLIEATNGEGDYIVYGANLTFVNLEEANIYGLELNGHKPSYANYNIKGVGDEGAVLILPGPEGNGRLVTLILPENQLREVEVELTKDWNLL